MKEDKLKKIAQQVADRHAHLDKDEISQAVIHRLATLTDKNARGVDATARCEQLAFDDN